MSSRYSQCYARTEKDGPFVLIEMVSDSPPFENQDLEQVSKEKGEIIYLAEQDNVGFFHYEHWSGGRLLRRLKYNSDYSWLNADGEPEEWEAEVLFSPDHLKATITSYGPEMGEEIRRVWQKKRIQEGETFPPLGSINIIGGLREYWHLRDSDS